MERYFLNDEKDSAEFLMGWCNASGMRFHDKDGNEKMFTILYKIKNEKYDMDLFYEAMINTKRFESEYEEYGYDFESEMELARLKVKDLLDYSYEDLKNEVL